MEREHLDLEEAKEYAEELEQARVAFFRKFFKAHPNDPNLYHIMLNMGKLQHQTAAEIIVHAAGDLAH
jgi:cytidylate kinase